MRAAFDRAPNDAVHALELALVDDRTEVDVLAVRVTKPEPIRLLLEEVDVVAGDAPMDDVTAGGEADLALELERGERTGGGSGLEIGVVEDDEGVVAAQLQRDALQKTASQGSDPPSRAG